MELNDTIYWPNTLFQVFASEKSARSWNVQWKAVGRWNEKRALEVYVGYNVQHEVTA